MSAIGLGAALVIGLSLGLLGGGGSILTVPAFVYLMGQEPRTAIAMSLAVVGLTSVVGAWRHWRAGRVDVRVGVQFGVVAMAGTYLGARLAVFVTPAFQMMLFALVMLVAAVLMLRRNTAPASESPAAAAAKGRTPWLIAAEGLAVGVLTGLVGVGGGFMIVPALVLLGRLPMKVAVGTSLLVIALKSVAGVAGYLGQIALPWSVLLPFAGVSIVGIVAGATLVRRVPQRALQRAFAALLIIVGAFVFYQNRDAVLHPAAAEVVSSH
jgi:uncharacterized membrane protein YfcA